MVVVDITASLYFRSAPPNAKKRGLVIAHKPRQTSPYLKEWQETFASAASGLFGSGQAQGRMAMANTMAGLIRGRSPGGGTSYHTEVPGIRGVKLSSAAAQRYNALRQSKHARRGVGPMAVPTF